MQEVVEVKVAYMTMLEIWRTTRVGWGGIDATQKKQEEQSHAWRRLEKLVESEEVRRIWISC